MIPKKIYLQLATMEPEDNCQADVVLTAKFSEKPDAEYISVDALKEWIKQQPQLYQSNVARINVTQAMDDLETFLNSEE